MRGACDAQSICIKAYGCMYVFGLLYSCRRHARNATTSHKDKQGLTDIQILLGILESNHIPYLLSWCAHRFFFTSL